jgi:hypothetical protein
MEQIIKTKYKDRLPKGLSYPIGAELLSQQLSEVPQFNAFELSFFFRCGKLYKVLNSQSIEFLTLAFKRSEKSISNTNKRKDSEWVKPHWNIYVSPVPSTIQKKVRKSCLELGFPIIKDWLIKDRPDNWYYGYKFIELTYDIVNETLIVIPESLSKKYNSAGPS